MYPTEEVNDPNMLTIKRVASSSLLDVLQPSFARCRHGLSFKAILPNRNLKGEHVSEWCGIILWICLFKQFNKMTIIRVNTMIMRRRLSVTDDQSEG
ncbi:hypothetical protein VNO80_05340 [Phaseolus coccineus]|uniref:Uncharacterized protein n=1 Tax=Phaseolus coccineus TaxID=3886 RepID=A0AAN9RMW8_PHACN